MQASQIERELSERMNGDAHELWIGQRREDRNEYICRVQRAGNEFPEGEDRDYCEHTEILRIVAEFESEANELAEGR